MMTTYVGWAIIVITFYLLGLLLLLPVFLGLGRSQFRRWMPPQVYALGAGICAVALWFALPLLVHRLLSH